VAKRAGAEAQMTFVMGGMTNVMVKKRKNVSVNSCGTSCVAM
jgi:glyceraldehyde-3-phosphate dehydrogenase/erythrose-4-phosphate dehydrogenase